MKELCLAIKRETTAEEKRQQDAGFLFPGQAQDSTASWWYLSL